jgi:hypothetical protein
VWLLARNAISLRRVLLTPYALLTSIQLISDEQTHAPAEPVAKLGHLRCAITYLLRMRLHYMTRSFKVDPINEKPLPQTLLHLAPLQKPIPGLSLRKG